MTPTNAAANKTAEDADFLPDWRSLWAERDDTWLRRGVLPPPLQIKHSSPFKV